VVKAIRLKSANPCTSCTYPNISILGIEGIKIRVAGKTLIYLKSGKSVTIKFVYSTS
jgi:hypothetical protein